METVTHQVTFGPAAIALIVALAAVVLVALGARRWMPRLLVSYGTLRENGFSGGIRLNLTMARLVYPVRLTGAGGPAHRFDLSLIDERPSLDLCGVPAGELSRLRDRNLQLVFHPEYLELWARSGLSYRRAAAFPRSDLHGVRFIEHDPDGLGLTDGRYRGSVGTLQVSFSERLQVYLLVRIKPKPALPAPGSTHPHGYS